MTKEIISKLVPDTSVIVEGIISSKLNKELEIEELIIHEAVLAELEHQANEGKIIGLMGLEEIETIRTLLKDKVRFTGNRPTFNHIRDAHLGEIDALIRQLAYDEEATLITADKVQYKVARAKGINAIFIAQSKEKIKLKLESYFDLITMSVHLKEGTLPTAKKGTPGNLEFVSLSKKRLSQKDVQDVAREIIEATRSRSDGFIEIEREGSTIVQLGLFRIVITRPPFSDGWEITAVRPVKQLTLEEYQLSEKLNARICKQAEGVLIAGSPGMGKSTFAAALTLHYAKQGKIVKTIEAPRDLVLPDEVTQYAISHGTPEEVKDILLLSRPDYTLFDEMRNTDDFLLYADLRLAGIGLAGVIHGTAPVDAIQRFVGRIELGVIPQVIDTVIFIKNGTVFKVLSLKMEVKVPAGMTEADLARPVVVIRDFETNQAEYELYSYGEETVLIPVTDTKIVERGVNKLARETIEDYMKNYADDVKVEIASPEKAIVYVPDEAIARIIGKQGAHIAQMEEALGMSLDIRELEGTPKKRDKQDNNELRFDVHEDKNAITFQLNKGMKNKEVNIYLHSDIVATATTGKNSTVRLNKKGKLGEKLSSALRKNEEIIILKK